MLALNINHNVLIKIKKLFIQNFDNNLNCLIYQEKINSHPENSNILYLIVLPYNKKYLNIADVKNI